MKPNHTNKPIVIIYMKVINKTERGLTPLAWFFTVVIMPFIVHVVVMLSLPSMIYHTLDPKQN